MAALLLPIDPSLPPVGVGLRLVDLVVAIAAARHVVGDHRRRTRIQRRELDAGLLAATRDDRALRDDPPTDLTAFEADLHRAADRPFGRDVDQSQSAFADVEGTRSARAPVGDGELDDRVQRGARMLAHAGRHDAVDLHGLRLALHRHRVELFGREAALHVLVRVLADDDRNAVVLGDGLESGRQVDGVADRRVLVPLLGAEAPHDGLARVDADTAANGHAELRLPSGGEPDGPLLELEGGPDRVERMLRVFARRVVERHDAVAHVLVYGAPMAEDDFGHHGEVLAEHLVY